MTKRKYIMALTPGDTATILFHGSKRDGNAPHEMKSIFKGVEGVGDDRKAVFDTVELYRYNGHWAYGSGAHKATLV
jgi:hypothetical protein